MIKITNKVSFLFRKYNISRKMFILFIIIILLLSSLSSITIVSSEKVNFKILKNYLDNSPNIFKNRETKKWTFIAYLMGDTSSDEPDMVEYINQMETIGSNSNVDIIVQADSEEIWGGSTRRYYIKNSSEGGSEIIENLGEKDMGDPDTLTSFTNWAIDNYPADNYFLLIFGHSRGWMGRMLRDETTPMSITDFQDSLKDISNHIKLKTEEAKEKIDILLMASCFMGMIEVCYQIKDYVNYYIASESAFAPNFISLESITGILSDFPFIDPEQTTKEIVNNCHWSENNMDHPLFGIKLNEMEKSLYVVDEIAKIGNSYIENGNEEIITEAFYQSVVFNAEERPNPHDLIALSQVYNSSQNEIKCREIQNIINNNLLIKPDGENYENWNGLSIYFPKEKNSDDMDLYKQLDFAKNTSWVSFLEKYYESSSERGLSKQILNIFEITNKNYFPVLYKIFKFFLLESK